jgi:DNA replication and repair protein RecF
MSLHISELQLVDFRSYHRFQLSDLSDLTIFVGPNAVGKTNLLEAIQLTTALTSFRSATTDQLIRWGADQARVTTRMIGDNRNLDVSLILQPKSRRYRLNGKPIRPADLQDTLPAVAFNPDDLMLVKGSPSARRRALDALGGQLSANYRSVKRDYDKIVQQRNKLLKQDVPALFVESLDEVFCKVAAQLSRYRLQMFQRLRRVFTERYGQISTGSEHASLRYRLSWESSDSADSLIADGKQLPDREELQQCIARALQGAAEEERIRKRSLVGPHRDTLDFLLNDHDAGEYASQGQQRSLAIAFKLTELALIEERRRQRPVLLLDDVMSEIDAARRSLLTEYLQGASQTFITTTNLGYFTPEILSSARIVQLPLNHTNSDE